MLTKQEKSELTGRLEAYVTAEMLANRQPGDAREAIANASKKFEELLKYIEEIS